MPYFVLSLSHALLGLEGESFLYLFVRLSFPLSSVGGKVELYSKRESGEWRKILLSNEVIFPSQKRKARMLT